MFFCLTGEFREHAGCVLRELAYIDEHPGFLPVATSVPVGSSSCWILIFNEVQVCRFPTVASTPFEAYSRFGDPFIKKGEVLEGFSRIKINQ